MNKAGIIIIPSWYPTVADPTSGIFIQQQAKVLQAAGLNIAILFLEESRIPCTTNVWYDNEAGLSTFRLKAFVPPKRIRWLRFYWYQKWEQLLDAYQEKYGFYPQLLHAHSFVAGVAAQHLGEKYAIPYVVTEHYDGFVSKRLPHHWQPDLRKLYTTAARVFAVSPVLVEAMKPYLDRKVELLPNIIDIELFRLGTDNHKNETFRIISIGSLEPRKNFAALLRAFAQLRSKRTFELIVIGEGVSKNKLLDLAQQLNISETTTFTGALPPSKVASYLQSSNLYISTSKSESFAIAPLEALACGVPVVILKCGSIVETFRDEAVLVVEHEADLEKGIAAQITRIDQLDMASISKYVRQEYAPRKLVQQLEPIYRELAIKPESAGWQS